MESAKIVKKQEKDTVSEEIPITIHAHNQNWTFHCGKHQPLANTMFIPLEKILHGKCMLYYPTVTGNLQLFDRTKTPAFYDMIYDDMVYLRAVIRPSEWVLTSWTGAHEQPVIARIISCITGKIITRLHFLNVTHSIQNV